MKRSIGSVQRQTLKDIEIIPVNDCSIDNSLEILTKMAENDLRIKIINNNNNRGLLYSRAMGILNSKGEYLINLDPDDELNSSDSLEYLYNIAKKSNIDIVCFNLFLNLDNSTIIKCSNYHHILRQPKLFKSIFDGNNRLNDFLISNKLIKREILLKAYDFFKNRIIDEKWTFHEDNIWSILVYKNAQSMICLNKIIYVYYLNKESSMLNRGNLLELKNIIYRHQMFEEIFDPKNEEQYLIAGFFEFKFIIENNHNFISIIKNNKEIKNSVTQIFRKYMNINESATIKLKGIS